jgi:topoisomerase-4 subunit B
MRETKAAEFSAGNLVLEEDIIDTTKKKGTKVILFLMLLKITNSVFDIIKMLKNTVT